MIAAHVLQRKGIGAQAEQAATLSMSSILSWDPQNVGLVSVCYVGNVTSAQIRYAVRRIRRRAPDVLIVIALFSNAEDVDEKQISSNMVFIERSLHSAVDKILKVAQGTSRMDAPVESTAAA